jgi:serine/threonine protein kinase/tetratricopeptide (TPR) repeat protein
MTTPSPIQRVTPDGANATAETIFYEALELPESERAGFIAKACADNADLCAEVGRYLLQYEKAGDFLKEDQLISSQFQSEFALLKREEAGDCIGPYKLLQQIGEGGFGIVWMAEQERPIRRRVALKIIKLGMDTKEVIARFEQERQALAMMDHPNIAKVLDAGATPTGRPFFVMELVRGIKITEYCDQEKLPTAERLQLFIAVCNAIQHAHQKGIIHRDLKPSNILVTLHDGVPVPKVIDFGVAKATQQQRLTDLTLFTQFEQMVGTPLYMSPEQAEMSGLDIDTRSDIYSLGVLLYELLVGRTPFDPEALMKKGIDEIRRAIREEEPQKPSTFVSTMAFDLRTNMAQHRQADGAKLIGQILGDLDWIVMKALEKDRNRRYETATGLANDIQRHLAHEPVHARPPSPLYRFRRFARRNKVAFGASVAVLAALIMGLGVSTWMFLQERQARKEQGRLRQLAEDAEAAQARERKNAEKEANKSGQVAQFLEDMLEAVKPAVAVGRDTTLLREILDKTAERVSKDLKDQPEVEADLRLTIGDAYAEIFEKEKARATFTEAVRIRKRIFGNEHPEVADAMDHLAHTLGAKEAEKLHREVLALRKRLLGGENEHVIHSMTSLAFTLRIQDRFVEAEELARQAVDLTRKLFGNEDSKLSPPLLALAQAVGHQGRQTESEALHRERLELLRKTVGNDDLDVAWTLLNLAQCLREQNRLTEAETANREALSLTKKLYPPTHPYIGSVAGSLGAILKREGNLADAENAFREALALQKKSLSAEHTDVINSVVGLSDVLRKQGKVQEGKELLREAIASARNSNQRDSGKLDKLLISFSNALRREGNYADAEPFARETLAIRTARDGTEHERVLSAVAGLGRLLTDWAWSERAAHWKDSSPGVSSVKTGFPTAHKRALEAERLLEDCVEMQERIAKPPPPWRQADYRSRLGGALVAVVATDLTLNGGAREKKLSQAESLLIEASETLLHGETVESVYKRDTVIRLIHLYETWNKRDKAVKWQQKLPEFDESEAAREDAPAAVSSNL